LIGSVLQWGLSRRPEKHLPFSKRLGLSNDHAAGQTTIQVGTAPSLQIRKLLVPAHFGRLHRGDAVSAEDIAARVHTLRHLLKQVGHDV
jgi:hypothetical protein